MVDRKERYFLGFVMNIFDGHSYHLYIGRIPPEGIPTVLCSELSACSSEYVKNNLSSVNISKNEEVMLASYEGKLMMFNSICTVEPVWTIPLKEAPSLL